MSSPDSTSEKMASALGPADAEKAAVGDGNDTAIQSGSPRQLHGFTWALVVLSTLCCMFIYALDITITADLIPTIVNEFDGVSLFTWVSVGFMIGGVAVALPLGKLYGLYNAKYLYIASVVIFLASSALCAAAPNMTAFIIGRVFAGAGGNGLYMGILTLLSVSTSDQERPSYLSLVGVIWGVGTVLGPVIGGAFKLVDWRWAFYINLIIGGVFAPVYIFLLPSFDPQPKGTTVKQRATGFDYLGTLLSIGAIITLVLGINFGGTVYDWNSGSIIALFVVSGVLFIAFAVQQRLALLTKPENIIFPIHYLKNKEAVLLFIAMAAVNAAGFIPISYIPTYFQFTRGDTAIKAAIRLLPYIVLLSSTIMLSGSLMSKLGYYMPWYAIGSILTIAGSVPLSLINVDTPTAQIYGFEVLVGIGTGAFIQAGYATIQTVVEASDMAYGLAFMMIAQLGGIVLGLSISGAVFLNRAEITLQNLFPEVSKDTIVQAISGTSGAFFDALSPDQQGLALAAIVGALRKVFILCYVAGAVSLVVSIFLRKTRAFVPTAAGA